MQSLFDAAGLSVLQSNILVLLLQFVLIALVFVGFTMINKALFPKRWSPGPGEY